MSLNRRGIQIAVMTMIIADYWHGRIKYSMASPDLGSVKQAETILKTVFGSEHQFRYLPVPTVPGKPFQPSWDEDGDWNEALSFEELKDYLDD